MAPVNISNAASISSQVLNAVKKSEITAKQLLLFINKNYKADGKTIPTKQYNEALKYYGQATKLIQQVKGKESEVYKKRLQLNSKNIIVQANSYSTAVQNGKILASYSKPIFSSLNNGSFSKITSNSTNNLKSSLNKQLVLEKKVTDKSTNSLLASLYRLIIYPL